MLTWTEKIALFFLSGLFTYCTYRAAMAPDMFYFVLWIVVALIDLGLASVIMNVEADNERD